MFPPPTLLGIGIVLRARRSTEVCFWKLRGPYSGRPSPVSSFKSYYFRSSQIFSDLAGFISGMWRGWGSRKRGKKKPSDESTRFPHPPPLPSHLPGIRSWLLLHFASADPQIPISHPALSKIPRSDVWPMDASKDHAQVRSSPLPTSQTAPLVSPRCTPTSASLRLRLTKNLSLIHISEPTRPY